MTRTCSVCGTPDLTAECPVCASAWEIREPAESMTREQRAKALRQIPEKLEIEFAKIHQRVEELVGRPVFTHEMGTSGMANLEHEILTGHVPSLGGVLAKIPDDKSVIVVSTEADDA